MTTNGQQLRLTFLHASPERKRGLLVLIAVVAASVVLSFMSLPLIRTLLSSPAGESASVESRDQSLRRFALGQEAHRDQFDGRSIFFIPPRPPPPPPPVVVEGPRPIPPPVLPTSYGGPAVIAMINNSVWLADGTRLTPAEPEGSGVTLVTTNAPWYARLRWKGVEFDVDLFLRDRIVVRPSEEPRPAPPRSQEASPSGAASDPTVAVEESEPTAPASDTLETTALPAGSPAAPPPANPMETR